MYTLHEVVWKKSGINKSIHDWKNSGVNKSIHDEKDCIFLGKNIMSKK